jgi:hypothetical protein
MKCFLTFSALVVSTYVIAQTNVLKGKVINAKKEGIAFATLLSLSDSKTGTVAQEDGSFTLTVSSTLSAYKIIVSALGYADTTLILKNEDLTSLKVFSLRESPLALPEVTVKRTKGTTFLLGSPQLDLLKYPDGRYYFVNASQPGAGVGTVFSTKKRKGTIESISVFMGESQPATYIMTLFALNDLGEDYRLYPKQQLVPIISQPISFTTHKVGWLDIEHLNLELPAGHLVVFLTKVKPSPTQDTTSSRTMFEYRVGCQFPQGIAARHIYLFGNQYAVFTKRDHVSAIYVTCRE